MNDDDENKIYVSFFVRNGFFKERFCCSCYRQINVIKLVIMFHWQIQRFIIVFRLGAGTIGDRQIQWFIID